MSKETELAEDLQKELILQAIGDGLAAEVARAVLLVRHVSRNEEEALALAVKLHEAAKNRGNARVEEVCRLAVRWMRLHPAPVLLPGEKP